MIPLLNQDEISYLHNSKGNIDHLLTTLPRHVDIQRYLNFVSFLFSVKNSPTNTKLPFPSLLKNRNSNSVRSMKQPVTNVSRPNTTHTLIPTYILTAFVNLFNNDYSIALMEEDLQDIERGHSRYCRAISRTFPKPQVHTNMSAVSKAMLAEVTLLAQQLTQKQVELNVNVYREHRTSLLQKLDSFVLDKSNITESQLMNYICPIIMKNFQKRRYYSRLKLKMVEVIKCTLNKWLHTALDMDLDPPVITNVHEIEMDESRRANKRSSQETSSSFTRPIEPPLKIRPSREKTFPSISLSPNASTGSITPTPTRVPSPIINIAPQSRNILTSDTYESVEIPTRTNSMPPTRSSSPLMMERSSKILPCRHFRPSTTRHTPYKIPRESHTNASKNASMKLVSSKDAFVELSTILVTGNNNISDINIQSIPESTHTHKLDASIMKDEFIRIANDSFNTCTKSESVIIQMVLSDVQTNPPPSHFSFQTSDNFLYENLKWITSLNRPVIFEVFVDNFNSISNIKWLQICSWCCHNNFSLYLTLPKDIESLSHDHVSIASSSSCILSVPFRQGLHQRC
jgi:hypothetical protein